MTQENPLTLFPSKRIRPFDGMSITADVWDQAHTYHNQTQRAHNLFFHGSGILSGLEVIASDPPDRLVYILPGAAVDANGNVIVLAEPVGYDMGSDIEGPLFLFISYRENIPPLDDTGKETDAGTIDAQFVITARSTLPNQPVIELARFTRQGRTAFLMDAQNTLHPRPNEIDLRYRIPLLAARVETVPAAVIYLGAVKDKAQGRGLARQAAEIRHTSPLNLVVDDDCLLDSTALDYSLLYLVGKGDFQLNAVQVKTLQNHLAGGGTLLLECLGAPAKTAFINLAAQLGAGLQTLPNDHPLLLQPHLFNTAPAGHESEGELLVGGGVLLSTFNYGLAWSGAGKNGALSREETRGLVEWAGNILSFVLERQRVAHTG